MADVVAVEQLLALDHSRSREAPARAHTLLATEHRRQSRSPYAHQVVALVMRDFGEHDAGVEGVPLGAADRVQGR